MSLGIQPRPLGADRADVRCVIPASTFPGGGAALVRAGRASSISSISWRRPCIPAIRSKAPIPALPCPNWWASSFRALAAGSSPAMHGEIRGHRPAQRQHHHHFAARKPTGPATASTMANATAAAGSGPARWPSTRRPTRAACGGSIRMAGRYEMDRGFHVSNGLGWSPDDKALLFHRHRQADHLCLRFRHARAAAIANRRVFVTVPESEGKPDGLTVDAEGFVWSAHWDGWCVTRYDPRRARWSGSSICRCRARRAACSAAPDMQTLVRHHPRASGFRPHNSPKRRCPAASLPSIPASRVCPTRCLPADGKGN